MSALLYQAPRQIVSVKTIEPVGGSNPADLSPVSLPNMRGMVTYTIRSDDNAYETTFTVQGGYGEFSSDATREFYLVPFTSDSGVTQMIPNRIVINTPVADAGGRVYVLNFVTAQTFGPTIAQSSVNIIGNNSLTVTMKSVGC